MPCVVGRQNYSIELEKRARFRQRLLRHHVETRSGKAPFLERLNQSVLIDYGATAGVYQDGRGFHSGEMGGPQQVPRLRRKWNMERNNIGLAQQPLQRNELDAGFGLGLLDISIIYQNPHPEGGHFSGHRTPDGAETDQAERELLDPA